MCLRSLAALFGVAICAQTPAPKANPPIVLNVTYTCSNANAHLQILSCNGKGNDEMCSVQYLNAYAPDGKGARVDQYRSMLEDGGLKGCTLPPGTPVPPPRITSKASAPASAPTAPVVPSTSARGTCSGPLKPGASIDAQWRGSWYPAKVVSCQAGQYQIRYASDKSEELVDSSRVRASGSNGNTTHTATSAPGTVKPGSYSCSAFIGTPPNGHMQPMPGITITAGNGYIHSTGNTRGTFSYDPAQSLILFKGGGLDGQAARYDQSPQGRPAIHIYNERRSRTVIDCDGPA